MNILGICGVAGSGKDTFAQYLAPLGATNIALADPLKQIAQQVYDFTDEQLWGPSAERNKPDPRYRRPHTWTEQDDSIHLTCSCCGQTTHARQVEDDVWVPDEDEVPLCHLTPRYALQLLGTDWGRHCYPDTWVTKCIRTAQHLLTGAPASMPYVYHPNYEGPRETYIGRIYPAYSAQKGLHDFKLLAEAERTRIVTVSDVRFRNEISIIREAGGKVVRVRRPGAGLGGAKGLHPSEAEQASIQDHEFDFVVENGGTLEAFELAALDIGRALLQ